MASHDLYLECFTCGKSFVRATTLRQHEDYSCQARVLFVCIPCGLTFDSNRFLDQHLIRHKRRESLLFSKEDYICNRCKTPFISPFTLTTHQLYSCPAICEFMLRNPPETTYSEDDPEFSDDEGKLKIVENAFESKNSNFFSRNNSANKEVVQKAPSANKIKALKRALRQTNIGEFASIWKNNKIENKLNKHSKPMSTVGFNKDANSFKASQRVKDFNANFDFGFGNTKNRIENGKETELINITNDRESYSSIELSGKELIVTQNSNKSKSNGELLVSYSKNKTLPKEPKLKMMPLKVVLKIKNIAKNTAPPDKISETSFAEKLSNMSATNVVDNSANVITTKHSTTKDALISKADASTEKVVKVISNSCVNDVVFEKERGIGNASKVFKDRRNFSPKTYPCRLCGRSFAYEETRACHESVICFRNTTDTQHVSYTCTKCHLVLTNADNFDLHTIMKCCPKLETFNARDLVNLKFANEFRVSGPITNAHIVETIISSNYFINIVLSPVSCQHCAMQFVQTTTLETHVQYCCTTQPIRKNLKEIIADPLEKKLQLVSCSN